MQDRFRINPSFNPEISKRWAVTNTIYVPFESWLDFDKKVLTNFQIKKNWDNFLYICSKLDCWIFILPRRTKKRKSGFFLDLWGDCIFKCLHLVVLWLKYSYCGQRSNPRLTWQLARHKFINSHTRPIKRRMYNFLRRGRVWIYTFEVYYIFGCNERSV